MSHDVTRRRLIAMAGAAPLVSFSAEERPGEAALAPQPEPSPGNATLELAQFASALTTENIPAGAQHLFGFYTLDCVSTMLAGCVQPVHRRVQKAMSHVMGTGTVTAVGGAPVSLSAAVMLDALAAADFEFEHVMASTHPSSTAFPALLGLAATRDLPGQDMLAAMVAAYELAARIGTASGPEVEEQRGFHNPGLNGTLAASAGCARLLGADAATCVSGMGIAASSSAGLMAYVDDGAMTKRLHPARCAQLGMESALMAMAGVEGPRNILESERGFLHAFSPKPRPAILTQGLGQEWLGLKMIAKFSPGHARAQGWIDAVNVARDRGEAWRASEIDHVVLTAPASMLPAKQMDRMPATLVSAQYSIAYCIAVAIARDLRNPMQMNDGAVSDSEVRRVASILRLNPGSDKEGPAKLTVVLPDRSLEIPVTSYRGAPGSEGYERGIESKFERTLAGLKIKEHAVGLRKAVASVGDRHGPLNLRKALVAAGKAAVQRA